MKSKHEKEASRMRSKSQKAGWYADVHASDVPLLARCLAGSLTLTLIAYRISEVPKSWVLGSAVNAGLVYSIITALQIDECHDSIYSTGMQMNTILSFKMSWQRLYSLTGNFHYTDFWNDLA